jgi:hypothetical protein
MDDTAAFLVVSITGRGFTSTLSHAELLDKWHNSVDDDGVAVSEWAEASGVDDDFTDTDNGIRITRIR